MSSAKWETFWLGLNVFRRTVYFFTDRFHRRTLFEMSVSYSHGISDDITQPVTIGFLTSKWQTTHCFQWDVVVMNLSPMCWYQYTMLGKGNEWLLTIFVFLMIPQNHPDKIITSIHISTTIFAFEHGRHFMSKLRKQWKLKKRYHFAGNYWTELIHPHPHPHPHPHIPTPPLDKMAAISPTIFSYAFS